MLQIKRSAGRVTWQVVFNKVVVYCHPNKHLVEEMAKSLASMYGLEVAK